VLPNPPPSLLAISFSPQSLSVKATLVGVLGTINLGNRLNFFFLPPDKICDQVSDAIVSSPVYNGVYVYDI
jgi:hypothetical protein